MRWGQSGVESMVTSRPVPQQTAQMVSPLAGQKRAPLRFSQIGQVTQPPTLREQKRGYAALQQESKIGPRLSQRLGVWRLYVLRAETHADEPRRDARQERPTVDELENPGRLAVGAAK